MSWNVGDALPPLTLPPVSRFTLALFAGASGDHNPIHIDLDFARQAGQPDVFAHGMLGMAWLCRLLTRWVAQPRIRQVQVRFQGLTRVGDIITATGEVIALESFNDQACARVAIRSTTQHGVEVIAGEALVSLT